MRGAHSISTRRAYGLQRICRHCARSSVYARRQATTSQVPCRRRGPVGAAPDDVLVGHIRRVLEASPFHGEGYRKAWAKLRVEGIRTCRMREHDLQAPHRVGRAHGPKAHDGTTTEVPDVMWGGHAATMTVGEGAAFVFVAVALYDRVHRPDAAARTASRPWSRSARASANASATSATDRPRAASSSRPRVQLSGGRLSTGGRVLRHRELAELRAGARRERRRGARHPHAEGESVVGAELRHHRGAPPGLARVQADVQRAVVLEKYHYRSPAQVRRDLVGLAKAAEYRQTTVQEPWGATRPTWPRPASPPSSSRSILTRRHAAHSGNTSASGSSKLTLFIEPS